MNLPKLGKKGKVDFNINIGIASLLAWAGVATIILHGTFWLAAQIGPTFGYNPDQIYVGPVLSAIIVGYALVVGSWAIKRFEPGTPITKATIGTGLVALGLVYVGMFVLPELAPDLFDATTQAVFGP